MIPKVINNNNNNNVIHVNQNKLILIYEKKIMR